jgi:aldehyde dehydrogenase (NAD+)
MMTETYPLVIGGETGEASDGGTFESIDPSTGLPFAEIARGGAADADRAIRAARKAFYEGPWPRMRGRERAQHLLKVADLVKKNAPALAQQEVHDAGHTIRMAKGADIGMAISTFRVMAELAGREDDERPLPRSPGSSNWLRYEPIGVCAAITPWNFPMQMAAWKIAPAIAAGNTVVIKPSQFASITTLEIARLCLEAGLPEGVVNAVAGPGVEVGEALVSSPMVDKIAFTGSTEIGRRIMQTAAGTVKKVTLELGGKSAAIVLDDVDLDHAVDGALWTAFFHNGQVCSAGTRLVVQRSIHDEFVAELVNRTNAIRVGPADDPASDAGPIINDAQLSTIERYVAIGRDEGAEVLTGGERPSVEGHEGGFYYRPTILGSVRSEMKVAQEEIFGPVVVVIPVEDDEEAVRVANDSVYGLAGGVWSGNNARAVKVADAMRTGTVWINDWHMINPRYPFGGYRQSGIGREHGELGLNEYREVKHIHVDLAGPDRARHPWWDYTVPSRRPPVPGPEAPGPEPSG